MPWRQAAGSGGHVPGPSGIPDGEFVRLIRDIVRYGDERLTASNAEVDPRTEDISGLVADMVETCHAAPGVGLAAPQIGINRRVAIIDLSIGADPGAVIVLVNPVLIESSGEQKEEEGCLSVPDIAEKVVRPERATMKTAPAWLPMISASATSSSGGGSSSTRS